MINQFFCPGDANGPYFRDDCVYYEYGKSYYPYRHLYNLIFPVIKDIINSPGVENDIDNGKREDDHTKNINIFVQILILYYNRLMA